MVGKTVMPENEVADEGKEAAIAKGESMKEANSTAEEEQLNAPYFTVAGKDIFVYAFLAKCATALMCAGYYLMFHAPPDGAEEDLKTLPKPLFFVCLYGGFLTVVSGGLVLIIYGGYRTAKNRNRYGRKFYERVWGMAVFWSMSFTLLEIPILSPFDDIWIGVAIFGIVAAFLDGWALSCLASVSLDPDYVVLWK